MCEWQMSSSAKTVDWIKELASDHPKNNVSPYIANLVGRDLHLRKDHPLGIIKEKIETVSASERACMSVCDREKTWVCVNFIISRSHGLDVQEKIDPAIASLYW